MFDIENIEIQEKREDLRRVSWTLCHSTRPANRATRRSSAQPRQRFVLIKIPEPKESRMTPFSHYITHPKKTRNKILISGGWVYLSDGGSEAIYAGLRIRGAVVPNHAGARPKCGGGGSGGDAVVAHDAGCHAAQSPGRFSLLSHSLELSSVKPWGNREDSKTVGGSLRWLQCHIGSELHQK